MHLHVLLRPTALGINQSGVSMYTHIGGFSFAASKGPTNYGVMTDLFDMMRFLSTPDDGCFTFY